ncbi:MAG TPA: polyprenyl synthetase family protein [Longimicrobiaceae bacterium]|nr:polyprenyl synthetase family protein [Longimicrobiaceae bacterium]
MWKQLNGARGDVRTHSAGEDVRSQSGFRSGIPALLRQEATRWITRNYLMAPEPGPYHHLVLGSSPNSFINLFQAQWKEHIKSFPKRYQTGKQLVLGSRFRPLLVSWGYLLSGGDFDEDDRAEIARVAVYVELLHKATLLIDDLIDQDDTRNGVPSFHVEFSNNEAILFAIYLLGDCLERLSVATATAHTEKWYPEVMELLGEAIKNMSLGAIEEVVSPDDQLASISKAKRIIELQTIALIKNGLLTGYKYGRGNMHHVDTIDSLGYDCGYLFQVLNDLEPFLGADLNVLHKGTVNFDVLRSRKNITVAFISDRLSSSERDRLHLLIRSADPLLPSLLHGWFSKYDVFSSMLENLRDVHKNIRASINSLPLDVQRRSDFSAFINYVLSGAVRRIGGAYGEKLSEILIR